MKYYIAILLCAAIQFTAGAQSFSDGILKFRQEHVKELMADPRAPLKRGDDRYLRFFDADVHYCVWADFTPTPGSQPFLIATHSGKQKPFKEYGTLTFTIHDTTLTLHVYQSVNLLNNGTAKNELFIPFTDGTNYELTFAGGRYIDMETSDIKDNRCQLDFNKCYNPLCAYADGFSCPIPPAENSLHVSILAGEKLYTKHVIE